MVCSDPWQAETVLCQAAGGSWLARELIRAKLATAEEDPQISPDLPRSPHIPPDLPE